MDKELLKRQFLVALVVLLSLLGGGFGVYLTIITPTAYTKFLAVLFLFSAIVAAFFNIMGAMYFYRSYNAPMPEMKPLKRFPTVAMVVVSYNEPVDMVEETLEKLRTVDYPTDKLSFYLLDDSTDKQIAAELAAYCRKNDVRFIHRTHREGFKAGALNNFLKDAAEEYIAIFDADEVLVDASFLKETLGCFKNDKIAYVQTSKRYAKGSPFADAVDSTFAFFSNFIQVSRNLDGMPMFAGSCGVIKREILEKLGGFDYSVVEDAAFSLKSDANGYGGVFIPKIYALGKPIENFTAFGSQQWRYNYGNTQLMSDYLANITKFNLRKQLGYLAFIFGLHYLSMLLIIFAVLSALIAFANLNGIGEVYYTLVVYHNISLPLTLRFQLEMLNVVTIFTTLLGVLLISKIYFGSYSIGVYAYFLNFGVAFIRAKAAIAALFSRAHKFGVIKKNNSPRLPWHKALGLTWLETLFSSVLFLAGIVAITNSDWVSSFWLVWYSVLFLSPFSLAFLRG